MCFHFLTNARLNSTDVTGNTFARVADENRSHFRHAKPVHQWRTEQNRDSLLHNRLQRSTANKHEFHISSHEFANLVENERIPKRVVIHSFFSQVRKLRLNCSFEEVLSHSRLVLDSREYFVVNSHVQAGHREENCGLDDFHVVQQLLCISRVKSDLDTQASTVCADQTLEHMRKGQIRNVSVTVIYAEPGVRHDTSLLCRNAGSVITRSNHHALRGARGSTCVSEGANVMLLLDLQLNVTADVNTY